MIEPYNETLNKTVVDERREWSRIVVEHFREQDLLTEGNTVVIHAGKVYYEELLPLLDDEPLDNEVSNRRLADW